MLKIIIILPFLALFSVQVIANDKIVITDARIGVPQPNTIRFILDINRPTGLQIFTLSDPSRLVIDLPNAIWALSRNTIPVKRSFIKTVRFGQFSQNTSRIVIDLDRSINITEAYLTEGKKTDNFHIVIEMEQESNNVQNEEALSISTYRKQKITDDSHLNMKKNSQVDTKYKKNRKNNVKNQITPSTDSNSPNPHPVRPKMISKPTIIVIDPGHGGRDSGAIAKGNIYEKNITLSAGLELAQLLINSGYTVHMTRKSDVYVSLSERVRIARRVQADLFISLHADAHPNNSIHGASVYTLSDKASDKEAERLAARENKVDIVNKIDLTEGYDPEVTQILISLIQKSTMSCSSAFATHLIPIMGKVTPLLDRTHRSAGFRVLKSPEVPSVLVELGYLTNRNDLKLLKNKVHQHKVSKSIVKAIDSFTIQKKC
tara:strand:+ start:9094 stop:10386 length:1293 start_codon:yes stop_codon:yes gene_type:complete